MVFFTKKAVLGVISTAATLAFLTACGGGGGSGGTGSDGGSTAPYQITLTAASYSLPLNLADARPGLNGYSGQGSNNPYTTALEVSATTAGRPIASSGDEEVFSCRVDDKGIEIGELYYLDGDDEHEVDYVYEGETIQIPGAYRAVALASFGGGATFHFHAWDTAGVAKITCAISDPRDGQVRETSIEIQVGESTQTPSDTYLETTTGGLGYVYTQGVGGNTQLLLQAGVFDSLNQPVPDPSDNNLYARIRYDLSSSAANGAKLSSASSSGNSWTVAKTINGRSTFTLHSGEESGNIVIEVVTDGLDNNVDNNQGCVGAVGDSCVRNLLQVQAITSLVTPTPALAIVAGALPGGDVDQPYVAALQAEGGTPPYTWTALTSLPAGLELTGQGFVTGTPTNAVTSQAFYAQVTDSAGLQAQQQFSITVAAKTDDLVIQGCASAVLSTPCALSAAVSAGQGATSTLRYDAYLNVSGGLTPYTWTVTGNTSGITANYSVVNDGSVLHLSSTGLSVPVGAAASSRTLLVTVVDGQGSRLSRSYSIAVPAYIEPPAEEETTSP